MFFSYVENGSTAIKFWTTITYTLPPFLLLVKLMSPCKQKMKHQYFWIPLETCLSLGSGAGRTSKISGAEQKWTDGRIQYEFWVEILCLFWEKAFGLEITTALNCAMTLFSLKYIIIQIVRSIIYYFLNYWYPCF